MCTRELTRLEGEAYTKLKMKSQNRARASIAGGEGGVGGLGLA